MIFFGSERAPSRGSPRDAALQAEDVQGEVRLHMPSSEKGERMPPLEKFGRYCKDRVRGADYHDANQNPRRSK